MKYLILITITLLIIINSCLRSPVEPANKVKTYYRADLIVAAPGQGSGPYKDPALLTNGVFAGENDVFTITGLDSNNFIILGWQEHTVINGAGSDLAVMENPFIIGGNAAAVFMEQAVIAVSSDMSNWVEFPHDYLNTNENSYVPNPALWSGFAGVKPVHYHETTNRVDIFASGKAGGDHFDLDDLPDTVHGRQIKSNGFKYIKITAAAAVVNPDTGSNFVYDKDNFYNGPDIDGVYARYVK
ncbi:MAG TPA: LIC_13355 family lipoprotein [Spirochaetota bacterium]|nr:LIC_13355 family lipoprotein [Spirochaetota bacterium]